MKHDLIKCFWNTVKNCNRWLFNGYRVKNIYNCVKFITYREFIVETAGIEIIVIIKLSKQTFMSKRKYNNLI